MRNEIQIRLGLKAVDVYGLSEILGPGVACECEEAQAGLHGWEDHFIFEVIDPESGKTVAEGQQGELVITTLTKEALPMLRYRTRDITRVSTERCECGRSHLRIRRITGRNDDMLIIRGVNVYPSQIEAVLVGMPEIAPHYQLVVERKGNLDHVTVELEASPDVVPGAEAYARIGGAARHQIKSMIGITTDVIVKKPGEIPRSMGKAVRVRDLRPKNP
jgi:phenylacetate-CoA ligase